MKSQAIHAVFEANIHAPTIVFDSNEIETRAQNTACSGGDDKSSRGGHYRYLWAKLESKCCVIPIRVPPKPAGSKYKQGCETLGEEANMAFSSSL